MTSITTHAALAVGKKLNFCYLCGNKRDSTNSHLFNDDHIPPTGVFLDPDRDPPLILPAHETCNSAQSGDDQRMSEIIGLLHGLSPNSNRTELGVMNAEGEDAPSLVTPFDVRVAIWRWVRGFHAALYGEYLPPRPPETERKIIPPLTGPTSDPHQEELHHAIVDSIKAARHRNSLDTLECRNQKCLYHCTWSWAGSGESLCLFGLQIYNWEDLGDPLAGYRRSCVGIYVPKQGKPPGASTVRPQDLPLFNMDRANAFGP